MSGLAVGKGHQNQRSDRSLVLALLLSVLAHTVLLSLLFGGKGQGRPGFGFPWQDRRAEALSMRVVLTPPKSVAEAATLPEIAPQRARENAQRSATETARETVRNTAGEAATATAAAVETAEVAEAAAEEVAEAAEAVERLVVPSLPVLRPANDLKLPQAEAMAAPVMPQVDLPLLPDRLPAQAEAPIKRTLADGSEIGSPSRQDLMRSEAMLAAVPSAVPIAVPEDRSAALASVPVPPQPLAMPAPPPSVDSRDRAEAAAAEQAAAEATSPAAASGAETARLEAVQRERERLEADRLAAARAASDLAEAQRQESLRQEAARLEAIRQETARQEAAKSEAARLQALQAGQAAQAEEQSRDARRRAMGRQLDLEAAQRAATAAATPAPGPLAYSLGSARRGRLFGRTDANAELVLYAEAWARKIQLASPAELFRDAAQRPHANPVVTVALRADGSVESVTFVRSSGLPELDEAVRRIVLRQVPYPAFQAELSRDYDVIEIRRTWHFDSAVRLY